MFCLRSRGGAEKKIEVKVFPFYAIPVIDIVLLYQLKPFGILFNALPEKLCEMYDFLDKFIFCFGTPPARMQS